MDKIRWAGGGTGARLRYIATARHRGTTDGGGKCIDWAGSGASCACFCDVAASGSRGPAHRAHVAGSVTHPTGRSTRIHRAWVAVVGWRYPCSDTRARLTGVGDVTHVAVVARGAGVGCQRAGCSAIAGSGVALVAAAGDGGAAANPRRTTDIGVSARKSVAAHGPSRSPVRACSRSRRARGRGVALTDCRARRGTAEATGADVGGAVAIGHAGLTRGLLDPAQTCLQRTHLTDAIRV